MWIIPLVVVIFFFFNDTATTEIYTLSLHVALPIYAILEGWLSLAFLAAATKRVRLGTLVTGVTYRHPAILVKQASTLDVLSGGRAYLGIGAAWNEREHRAFGVEYGTWTDR